MVSPFTGRGPTFEPFDDTKGEHSSQRKCRNTNTACGARKEWLTALERFQLIQRARPIRAQKPRQSAIGQQLATCLATRAVIRLVVRIPDALNFLAATRAGLTVSSMSGHPFAKRRYVLRELLARLGVELVDPNLQRVAGRGVQPIPLVCF